VEAVDSHSERSGKAAAKEVEEVGTCGAAMSDATLYLLLNRFSFDCRLIPLSSSDRSSSLVLLSTMMNSRYFHLDLAHCRSIQLRIQCLFTLQNLIFIASYIFLSNIIKILKHSCSTVKF
jgi:hypothetical protein